MICQETDRASALPDHFFEYAWKISNALTDTLESLQDLYAVNEFNEIESL
jgi:hypothetical protein